MEIKTGCWFAKPPEGHIKIGISRGIPRRMEAGYRVFKKLAPGAWFNSVSAEEYYHLYRTEILGPLNPKVVAGELVDLSRGAIPVMMCYERAGGTDWCHRAMAAEWLAEALGRPVPEVGFEHLPQEQHPLMPAGLRRPVAGQDAPPDLSPFIGREATINGELHQVVEIDPQDPRRAIVAAGERRFPAGLDTLNRHFAA